MLQYRGMMTRWLKLLSLIGILALLGSLAACGGGGGGAAAPSGGGDTPVAVEIPSLGEAAGLPFASAVVISGSSDIVAAIKATPSSWIYKSFNVTDSNAFTTGDSAHACEYRNFAGLALQNLSEPDLALCAIKTSISKFTTPYDGSYHILSTGAGKIKFKFTRNSSNLITAYEQFSCTTEGVQESYTSYTLSGSSLTATMKIIRPLGQPKNNDITISGTMSTSDSNRYTAKFGTYAYTGTLGSGAVQGAISMAQSASTMLLDGFDSRGSGSNIQRIYGQADQSNSSSPFAITGYTFGAGAAVRIDNGTSSTAGWDGTSNDPTTCSGSNCTAVTGKTPKAVSTQTISGFSGSTAWDCSGTVEVTETFSSSAGSCFQRFTLSSANIDCTTATQGNLTVTPTVSSATLSTNSSSPTSVSTTPSIVLTASRALDDTSVNSTTVTLVNNSTSDTVTLTYAGSQFSSDTKTVTFTPTLTSGQTYKLTLVGSSTTATSGTVIRSPGATPPADQLQATANYYITP